MELIYQHLIFDSEKQLEGNARRYYAALIRRLNLKTRCEPAIDSVKAKHFPCYGKGHVSAVVISDSETTFIPLLGSHYVNLVAIKLTDCGLEEISKDDLGQFSSLKKLYLSNNSLQSLPADLFDGTPHLEIMSFRNNKIRFISQHTLTPLQYLKFADFRGNVCIDEVYSYSNFSSGITLSSLQAKIVLQSLQCNANVKSEGAVISYVERLWHGDFSDFQITTKKDILKVHKAVLSVNSPVFAAMFTHKMEENLKNEMAIENFLPETVKDFLAFVYLRVLPQHPTSATDLYAMSEEYQVNELSQCIQWNVAIGVSAENASELFKFGVLYNNAVIKRAAFEELEKSLSRKLPVTLMESADDMMELLEAKKKMDEIINRALK